MTKNNFTTMAFVALAALGFTSVTNAAPSLAPTLKLSCSFKSSRRDIVGDAYLTLDLARMKAESDFRLLSVAVVGGTLNFSNVESFVHSGNQYELILKSVAQENFSIDGSINLHFAEADVNAIIAGTTSEIAATVVQATNEHGEIFADGPCTLDQQDLHTKDATEDRAIDPFVRNVNIKNEAADGTYPIWKNLRTPNFEIFCAITSARRAFGINWPVQEECTFRLRALKTADGKYYYRDLVGSEAELVYNTLPNHEAKFVGVPMIVSSAQSRLLAITVTCESSKHCLVKAKPGPVTIK